MPLEQTNNGTRIMNEPAHKSSTAETDPRFPSGPWLGFWIQRGYGKQSMSLSLGFANGRVDGAGRDIVGQFTFSGTYDLKTGCVQIVKQYLGKHRVLYDGANQGDGMWLWGLWTLRYLRGGFHLWPEGEEDPTIHRLKTEQELPATALPAGLKKGELLPR